MYCRTKWDYGSGKGDGEAGEEGYMNLGKLAGLTTSRGKIFSVSDADIKTRARITISGGVEVLMENRGVGINCFLFLWIC